MALWTVHGDGRPIAGSVVIGSGERPSWLWTAGFGLQHAVVVFGTTTLVPVLIGLPPETTLLCSGTGTLLYLLLTRNRLPGYLAASTAFVVPLSTAAADTTAGPAALLGGMLVVGVVVIAVGVAVKALGVRLLESALPPPVAGAMVLLVGLNLAPHAASALSAGPLPGLVTLGVLVIGVALRRGIPSRFTVLLAVVCGWLWAATSGGLDEARLERVARADWTGLLELTTPEVRPSVAVALLPLVIVLVANNLGHVKALGALTRRDLDGSAGDSLIAGGIAAVVLSFSPKGVAVLATVPAGVIGATGLVLIGMFVLVGARIYVDHHVDVTDPANAVVLGAALVAGVGGLTFTTGDVRLPGMVWGSVGAMLLHPLLRGLVGRRDAGDAAAPRS